MSGFDIHLDKILTRTELLRAATQCFNTQRPVQLLDRSLYPAELKVDELSVVFAHIDTGDFPSWLEFVYPPGAHNEDEGVLAKNFCKSAEVSALISTDDPYPYSWLYIHPDGTEEVVHVDEEVYDSTNGLVITSTGFR